MPSETLERALAFVAEFKGDPRCSLNCAHAEALAAEVLRVRGELDRLAIIEEAFDLSMQRADRIMRLARTIGTEADAIFCSENDIRHDRKLPAKEDA